MESRLSNWRSCGGGHTRAAPAFLSTSIIEVRNGEPPNFLNNKKLFVFHLILSFFPFLYWSLFQRFGQWQSIPMTIHPFYQNSLRTFPSFCVNKTRVLLSLCPRSFPGSLNRFESSVWNWNDGAAASPASREPKVRFYLLWNLSHPIILLISNIARKLNITIGIPPPALSPAIFRFSQFVIFLRKNIPLRSFAWTDAFHHVQHPVPPHLTGIFIRPTPKRNHKILSAIMAFTDTGFLYKSRLLCS